MCGIAGYHGLSAGPGRHALERMQEALRFRGPDGRGIFQHGANGLAHTRLSVLDPAGGAQPLANEDGSVIAIVNGEIYNHRGLRAGLEAKGHRFSTRSDSEAVLHLYEEEGPACLARLDGMFALAVLDIRRDRLLLARDPFGKKPLHYARHGGAFWFASELKALLTLPAFPRELSREALAAFLAHQYVPDGMCILKGVEKIQPGEYLLLEGGKERERGRYVSLQVAEEDMPWPEAVEKTRALVAQAVAKRLEADVPLGVFLSGGLDSSIVAALAAQAAPRAIRTFSMGFAEKRFDESPKARALARKYGTDHHEFVLDPRRLAAELPEILGYLDEPLADPSVLPLHQLCREARREVTVALGGDGGDELFAGYVRYLWDRRLAPLERLPAGAFRALDAALRPFRVDAGVPMGQSLLGAAKRLSQWRSLPASASILRWTSYFPPALQADLLLPGIREGLDLDAPVKWLAGLYAAPAAADRLNRTCRADLLAYAPGDYLVKADRMSMRNSLELRSPFLDRELAEFAFRLPGRLKLRGGLKGLLKAAFGRDLPPEVLHGPKRGFSVPVGAWMKGEWLALYRERAASAASFTRRHFDAKFVESLIAEHTAGREDHGKRLYALLCLEIWSERWG
jgi:asparagine synthase (glutamine-hydrolysing)